MSDKYAALEEAAAYSILEEGQIWWDEQQLSYDDGVVFHKADMQFIALASPETILELLSEREADKARIAELEARKLTAAAKDVLAERLRQMSAEGWTPERDDTYHDSELADAAACYALHAHNQGFPTPAHWPWDRAWWKQTNPRRDLVKAGALILAEIERIDRAAGITLETGE